MRVEQVFNELLELEGKPGACSNHVGLLAEIETVPVHNRGRHSLNQRVIDLAAELLSEGREEAERRRSGSRALSSMGMACAVAATLGGRSETVGRRKFLRKGLQATAVLALTPGIGYSVLSELIVPSELSAFDRAEKSLEQLAQAQRSHAADDGLPS